MFREAIEEEEAALEPACNIDGEIRLCKLTKTNCTNDAKWKAEFIFETTWEVIERVFADNSKSLSGTELVINAQENE